MNKTYSTRGQHKRTLIRLLQSYSLDDIIKMTKRTKEWCQMILDTKSTEVDEVAKDK